MTHNAQTSGNPSSPDIHPIMLRLCVVAAVAAAVAAADHKKQLLEPHVAEIAEISDRFVA